MVKNKSKDRFLSTSDDSTIRIWKIKSFPLSDGGINYISLFFFCIYYLFIHNIVFLRF